MRIATITLLSLFSGAFLHGYESIDSVKDLQGYLQIVKRAERGAKLSKEDFEKQVAGNALLKGYIEAFLTAEVWHASPATDMPQEEMDILRQKMERYLSGYLDRHPEAVGSQVRDVIVAATVEMLPKSEQDWQRDAVKKYPQLGINNSTLNQRFISEVKRLRGEEPGFFKNPRWPMILADGVSAAPRPSPFARADDDGGKNTKAQQKRFPIDKNTEGPAAEIKRRGEWTQEEVATFESIDPNGLYKTVRRDKDGKVVDGFDTIKGSELRHALMMVKLTALGR